MKVRCDKRPSTKPTPYFALSAILSLALCCKRLYSNISEHSVFWRQLQCQSSNLYSDQSPVINSSVRGPFCEAVASFKRSCRWLRAKSLKRTGVINYQSPGYSSSAFFRPRLTALGDSSFFLETHFSSVLFDLGDSSNPCKEWLYRGVSVVDWCRPFEGDSAFVSYLTKDGEYFGKYCAGDFEPSCIARLRKSETESEPLRCFAQHRPGALSTDKSRAAIAPGYIVDIAAQKVLTALASSSVGSMSFSRYEESNIYTASAFCFRIFDTRDKDPSAATVRHQTSLNLDSTFSSEPEIYQKSEFTVRVTSFDVSDLS